MNDEGGPIILIIVAILMLTGVIDLVLDDDLPPEQTQEIIEQPLDESLIEGVVLKLIPGTNDVTTVVFDDGREIDLKLGDNEIYVGEWNQLRVDDNIVHESYLGEGTVQRIAKGQ